MFVDTTGREKTVADEQAYLMGHITYVDSEAISQYTEDYKTAQTNKDYSGMNTAHANVALIRSKYDPNYIYNDRYDYTHGGTYFAEGNDTVKDESWMIVVGIVGGAVAIKAGAVIATVLASSASAAPTIATISQQTQNHILQEKHAWGDVVSDPNNWNAVSGVINNVMKNGTEGAYGAAMQKTLQVGNNVVVVTYKVVDNIIRISDSWVQTK
jgi:hypothetical protein